MKRHPIYLILITFCFCISIQQSFSQCGQLVWSDEFDGTSIDQNKWAFDLGNGCPSTCGWGNAELQSYTNSASNVRLNNGKLEIEAKWEGGSTYTSARLTTKNKHSWKYGRFEMRARIPSGTGIWPAFWMLPVNGTWPLTGEIDIMEMRGDEIQKTTGTLHYGDFYPANRHDGDDYWLPQEQGTFEDDFHIFAVEWEAGEIRWYLDGNLFKTETKNPNSLNPTSNNNPWPWDDNEFYLILNLAIGGPQTPFTGSQNPSFGNSALMEVDYVRVFDSPQPNISISGPAKAFEMDVIQYSVPTNPNENYTWSVPAGATITQGQGTNQISIDWGTSNGGDVEIQIQHLAGATCPGNTFFYTRAVEVFDNSCAFNFESFDNPATMVSGFRTGDYSEVNNPGSNGINSSSLVGKYVRNGGEQYDVLIFENGLLDPAADYTGGNKVFKMDINTDAPIGTVIELQIGNIDYTAGGFPNGVHSIYAGVTKTQNQWETITFTHTQSPDPNGATYANNLNRIIALFAPNTFTGNTYHFDNLRRDLATPPGALSLSGPASIAANELGVAFTATGGNLSSSFEWTLPVGASIASGSGSASITANFALSGGAIAVTERVTEGCTGTPAIIPISVGGNSCALFADEYDDNNTNNWITTNGQAGFFHSETGSDWNINSTGHDEWASVDYDLNDGINDIMLDFTSTGNNPLLHIRAKASAPVFLRITMVDDAGIVAANQFLSPLNGLELTTQYQEFTIDFNGQLWNENGGGALDESKIDKIQLSLNPGFASFPITGYATPFSGDVQIDYIRVGDECATATANFVADKTSLCGTGETVNFIDQSISTDGNTTYSWDFGSDASVNGANTVGPHQVSYSTPGLKTVTLSLDNGASVKTRTDYIFVGTTQGGCVSEMGFNSTQEANFFSNFGNFTFSQSGSDGTITTAGYDEWDHVELAINDGTNTFPLNFGCTSTKPIIKFRAKASSNCALRITFADVNGVEAASDGLFTNNIFELTNTYQTFEVDLTGFFYNQFAQGGPIDVDSTQIENVFLAINPGFASFPIIGNNATYNSSFIGSIDFDIISIGAPCVITGVNETVFGSGIEIFPNPFTDDLRVTSLKNLDGITAEIMNTQGILMSSTTVKDGTIAIDESLSKGLYLIRFISENATYITSVMKQ